VEKVQFNCNNAKGKLSVNMKSNIVAVSLFSGAGGLDVASFLAGVPVVISTDFDSDCIETLKSNELFAEAEIIKGDLHKIDSSVFQEVLKKREHDKFIVIGGAPCQPFSKAGYWVGHETRRGINDPRATLVNEYLRVVTDLHPDGFVFENVESLLHPTNKVIVDRFIEIITEQGYKYKIVRANAQDYGVPQKRRRLFILGTKSEFKSDEPRKTHCLESECQTTGLKPYVNVGEVIAGFDGPEFFEPEEVVDGGTYASDLKEVPPGMNYKALTAWYGYPTPKFVAEKRYWSFLLKLSPNMPSWTITAQPGPWIGPFHWDNRRLRVPEIAAIQTFPKGYKFYGTRRSVQKQIGNAVPSLMGKAMIEHVKESIE
jgi:DNA (cytosine-5)-methyltransferase 1